jgi:intein/homing endonuclease
MTNICVTGDTIINIKIQEEEHVCNIDEVGELLKMFKNVYTLSYNTETKKKEWKLITDFGMTDDFSEVYEVYDINNNRKIKCTAHHKFLTGRGWVECKDLLESDTLVS